MPFSQTLALLVLAAWAPAELTLQAPPHARGATPFRISAVRIVDASGAGDFSEIQPAIDASASGDVVLVRAGSYARFTLAGKGIAIVEENAAVAEVAGPSIVRDVPAGELAVLAGLNVVGTAPGIALEIEDCAGPVRLQRAAFFGGAGGAGPGGIALSIDSVADIALVACEMFGGDGGAPAPGGAGGHGGRALDSGVVLWGATCEGGDGGAGPTGGCSSPGGAAFEHENGALFAAASFFRGGAGGANDDCASGCGGDGGGGLAVLLSPVVRPPPVIAHLLGNLCSGGAGGAHPCGAPGAAGTPGGGAGGTNDVIAGTARKMLSPTPVRDAAPMPVTLHGEPGDLVFLVVSTASAHEWNPALHGVRLVGSSFLQAALGTVPASGVLVTSLAIPDAWAAPGAATIVHAQPAFVTPSGEVYLGNPSTIVVLDHTL